MLQQFLQLPLVEYCSSIDFSTTKHSSATASTVLVATISATAIDYWLFSQQTQPALTTASATRYTTGIDYTLHSSCCISHWNSLFALATTNKHNSCCHNFYNCHWSLIFQPANNARYTTAIHSQCCFSYSICSARPPISVHVAFPIATMFNFRHCHWQQDTQLLPHFMLHFPLPLSYYNCH